MRKIKLEQLRVGDKFTFIPEGEEASFYLVKEVLDDRVISNLYASGSPIRGDEEHLFSQQEGNVPSYIVQESRCTSAREIDERFASRAAKRFTQADIDEALRRGYDAAVEDVLKQLTTWTDAIKERRA